MDRKRFVVQFFILVCTIGAICLCSIRVYRYGLNNDSTLVDYQQFTEIKEYFFPTVSFCLCNMFLEDRLAIYGFNKSTYLEFLKGEAFENEMMTSNYQNMTIDMVDYIVGYRIYFRNFSIIKADSGISLDEKKKLVYNNFNGFIEPYLDFCKCFSLVIPKIKELWIFRILISNDIFPDGLRPVESDLKTFIHLPKQFLLSKYNKKWEWPYRSKQETYKLRFIIRSMDIVTKRDKRDMPCNQNWENYDDWVVQSFKNETGCNNPYQFYDNRLPTCNAKEEIKRAMFRQNVVEERKYTKPCTTMENLRWNWAESTYKKVVDNETSGTFWLSIQVNSETYKEIIHDR